MVQMEIDIKIVLLVMANIILIDLVVDVVVHMAPQLVGMVVPQMILIEVALIVSPHQNSEDHVDIIDILNNMVNLNRV